MNKQINIKKKANDIEIKYIGLLLDSVDINKMESLLDDFINNHRHDCMTENITIIRTIMDGCYENLLDISYQNQKDFENVTYSDSNLILYEKINDNLKIKYNNASGISFRCNDSKIDCSDYSKIKEVSEKINEEVEQIYCLQNTNKIIIEQDDILLIEIYKLFYNENPDFSKKDVNIKIQTMMSVLAEFGISLGNSYYFSLFGKRKMPLSLVLEQRVNKLYPLGKVSNLEDCVKLAKEPKEIIKIVGECIREAISFEQNQNEALITISKIIYAGRYDLSSNRDLEKISELSNCSTDLVKSSITLVKRIENRIKKI